MIDVRGIRILGDRDPKATRLIIEQQQDESYSAVGRRLSEVACEDPDGVDLVLFHNPRAVTTMLADGCVPALLSGHMHTRTDPEQVEQASGTSVPPPPVRRRTSPGSARCAAPPR